MDGWQSELSPSRPGYYWVRWRGLSSGRAWLCEYIDEYLYYFGDNAPDKPSDVLAGTEFYGPIHPPAPTLPPVHPPTKQWTNSPAKGPGVWLAATTMGSELSETTPVVMIGRGRDYDYMGRKQYAPFYLIEGSPLESTIYMKYRGSNIWSARRDSPRAEAVAHGIEWTPMSGTMYYGPLTNKEIEDWQFTHELPRL